MLTREQIENFSLFVRTAAKRGGFTQDDNLPAWVWKHRLLMVGRGNDVLVSPAGHDLLATVPHLPAPEPEPAPPSCSRCGGETEVPLFMGPLMMPCPACSNDDGSPKRWSWTAPSEYPPQHAPASFPCHPRDLSPATAERETLTRMGELTGMPAGDGWVHIDSEEKAKAFVGCMVEVHAPACDAFFAHPLNGVRTPLDSVDEDGMYLMSQRSRFVDWYHRGNVYLRPVPE